MHINCSLRQVAIGHFNSDIFLAVKFLADLRVVTEPAAGDTVLWIAAEMLLLTWIGQKGPLGFCQRFNTYVIDVN